MNNDIMTLGIFAHANAGKTTITEQLLVHTKVKKQTGRVDHGNTTTDNMKIEQSRGISVRASLVTIPLQNKTIQLIDTPGHVDFSAEVERAINVLDGAILVISGVEGIEPQTQVIWNILKEKQVPTVIFINKMDRMGADYERTLNEIHTKLDSRILPKIIVEKDDTSKDGLLYIEPSQEYVKERLADVDSEIMEKYINDEIIDKDMIEISTSMRSISEITSSQSENVGKATNVITTMADKVYKATTNNSDKSEESLIVVDEILDNIINLKQSIELLKYSSDNLNNIVEGFKFK